MKENQPSRSWSVIREATREDDRRTKMIKACDRCARQGTHEGMQGHTRKKKVKERNFKKKKKKKKNRKSQRNKENYQEKIASV